MKNNLKLQVLFTKYLYDDKFMDYVVWVSRVEPIGGMISVCRKLIVLPKAEASHK
jgi:hypothetical protein